MKLALVTFSISALGVLAAPSLEPRQNDLPECRDGINGPDGDFNNRAWMRRLSTSDKAGDANEMQFRRRVQKGMHP